jgi:hypothetical protein
MSSIPIETQHILVSLFQDPSLGGVSASAFWKILSQNGYKQQLNLKREPTLQFLKSLEHIQRIQRPIAPRKVNFPITSPNGPFSKLMIDIMELGRVLKYLLICIDVSTRYVTIAFINNKNVSAVKAGLLQCFKEISHVNGFIPSSFDLIADKESAWEKSTAMKKFFEENEITTHFTHHDYRSKSLVERFIRTLRQYMENYRKTHRGVIAWKEIIPLLINKYNTKLTHSTIKQIPIEAVVAGGPTNRSYMRNVQNRIKKAKQLQNRFGYTKKEYFPGDKVRIELVRPQGNLIGKKGGREFSTRAYEIEKRVARGQYKVIGIHHRTFRVSELIPVIESNNNDNNDDQVHLNVHVSRPMEEEKARENLENAVEHAESVSNSVYHNYLPYSRPQRQAKPRDFTAPYIRF